MKHLFAAALALSVGLGASGAALAQAPAVQCDVVMQSQAGGMIEVRSGAQASAPPLITWRPAASSLRVELLVIYQGSSLTGFSEPSGVYLRFPMEAGTPPESTILNVRTQTGRYWRFVGQGHERGPEDFGFVQFGAELAYGRALLSAIADGLPLSISVDHYDRSLGNTVFGTAAQHARDALLEQARRKFEAGDPAMCKRS
jgi:hypothetical protein